MSIQDQLNELQRKLDSDDEIIGVSRLRLIQILTKIQEEKCLNQITPTCFNAPMQKKFKEPRIIENQETDVFLKEQPNNGKVKIHKKLYQYADVKDWTYNQFSWDQKVRESLLKVFGKENFRPNQRAIVNCVLSGKDVFVCMPTGYGKSLTFQIPALIEEGVTIVIMPLISLVFDQVTYLKSLGVQVENACGQYKVPKYSDIIRNGIKLIYTTPEKLEKSEVFQNLLKELYQNNLMNRVIVDEAHCVSKWGRDFRPDYLKLTNVRTKYPGVPIMALTATAPEEVKEDIIRLLQITNCLYLQSSFNRENLIYIVKKRGKTEKTLQDIKQFIQANYPKQCGIIYCLTQKECEHVSECLNKIGIIANFYHAGISETERNKVHESWMMNEIQLIVATIAFGMGIDKKDCRFVIHYQMPKSIENYYQESGRAGRDGKLAHCLLYFSDEDYRINITLMDKSQLPPKMKKYNIDKLSQMQAFCNNQDDCRRSMQLSYLGEIFDPIKCNKTCDNCQRQGNGYTYKDYTKECIKILEFLKNYQLTEKQLTLALKGNSVKPKQGKRHINLDMVNGLLKNNAEDIPQILNQLKIQNLIEQKIVVVGKGSYKNRCVYLTSSPKQIYQFKELKLKVYEKEEKQRITEEKHTSDLFKKYLQDNKHSNKQSTLTQQWNTKEVGRETNSLKYHQAYGYWQIQKQYIPQSNQEQFLQIQERLQMERKRIYLNRQNSNDAVFNIEHILSNDDLEELCRKLPQNQTELMDSFILIGMQIKQKSYMKEFLDEIAHFTQFEEINKDQFIIEKQQKNQNNIVPQEIFEFDKFIKEEERELVIDLSETVVDIEKMHNLVDDLDPQELIQSSDEEVDPVQNLNSSRQLTKDDIDFILSVYEEEQPNKNMQNLLKRQNI